MLQTRTTVRAGRALSREQLRELGRDLRRELERLERSIAADPDAGDGARSARSALHAAAASEGGLAVALEARTRSRREALEGALRRLEAGTYGICASCHEPIPYGRLVVMPEAQHCVACGSRA